MKGARTKKVGKFKIDKIVTPVLALVVLVAIFIVATYNVLDYFATDIVTTYLAEVVAHDQSNISSYVSDRYDVMRVLYEDIKTRDVDNIDEILSELNVQARVQGVEQFYLVDSDNNLYGSNFVVIPADENPFLDFFDDNTEVNVGRYDEPNKYGDYPKQYMLYTMNFKSKPIKYKNNSTEFVGIVMLRDVNYIRGRMRISSFDDRGYTSVVDKNGVFVVSDDYFSALGQEDNCFDLFSRGVLDGITLDEIEDKVKARESFTFWYTDLKGIEKFILISPAANSDWTYLASIEKSVYTEQLQRFIEIIAFVMGGLFITFMIIFLLFRYSRSKLTAFYSSVADGVRSRQYYDDKVVDATVTALAIVDIDHLKWINDTHGHLAGDEAIRKMATVLVKRVGSLGEVCRFGGDEFVIAFQREIDKDEFRSVVNNIVEDVRLIRLDDNPDFRMTLSIGAYYGYGIAEQMFTKADELLYEAKKERDRAIVYVPKDERAIYMKQES